MDETKERWLSTHLQCPRCRWADIEYVEDAAECRHCGQRYRQADGVIDFLDTDSLEKFHIVSTDNVSDHPFDGSALAIIEKCADHGGWVLDCGSGYKSNTFPNLIQMEVVPYPFVDVLAVNQRLPFKDSTFDAVFSLDVLEHVDDPFQSALEITRVLKPGGVVYIDLPFLQAEHGYPHHYFNATRMGLQQLFNTLTVMSHHVPLSGHPIFTVHQILSVYTEGLPIAQRERLSGMAVAELISKGPLDWLSDPLVTELRGDALWPIAATTQALLCKPSTPHGHAAVQVVPQELPGFPEFVASAPDASLHTTTNGVPRDIQASQEDSTSITEMAIPSPAVIPAEPGGNGRIGDAQSAASHRDTGPHESGVEMRVSATERALILRKRQLLESVRALRRGRPRHR
jgi:SAM-dependent methyltransferase